VTGVTTSDGVRLYAEVAGSGPPILFIHEFAADHRTWTRQVEALSGEFRCITYDARGYPPSEVDRLGLEAADLRREHGPEDAGVVERIDERRRHAPLFDSLRVLADQRLKGARDIDERPH
jgi:pimeloyl-ACP methyl ester carboxylesterase